MKEKLRILHIEDLPTDAEIVQRELKKSGLEFSIKVVDSEADYIVALTEFTPDVILCDHSLPSFNSLQALKIAKKANLHIPFLLITATMSEDVAMSVIKVGADDFILKDRLSRLPIAITNGIKKYTYEKEKKEYLEQLENSEKRFKALVENSADAVVVLDANGKPSYISPSTEKILGYSQEETESLSLFELIHPEDIEGVSAKMAECFKKPGETINGYTGRIKHKNGSWRWMEATLTNLLHDPAIRGIVDNFHDVTERVLHAQATEENERKLAAAQRVANVGSWEADLVKRKVNLSAETYRIFELPVQVSTNYQTFFDLIHPEDTEKVTSAFFNSFSYKDISIIEHRIITKTGVLKFVEHRWQITYDNTGKPLRASGTTQDVTKRKKAELSVVENEAFTASLLDSLASNIAVINAAGTIIKVNKSWNTFASDNNATSLDKCGVGANYFDVCTKASRAGNKISFEAMEGITKVLSGESKDFYLEYPCHSPNEQRWFYMRVTRIDHKEPLALIEHHYITERKIAEQKVIETSQELKRTLSEVDKIMNSSLDIICSLNGDGTFVKLSAAVERICGYQPEELVGVNFMELVFDEDKYRTSLIAENLLNGIPSTNFENRFIHKNGSLINLRWSATYDQAENLVIGIAKDVTHQKVLELTIESEKERFQNIFMQAPSCMGSLKGANHIFESANPLYLELIGKQDIIGKSVANVLPEIVEQGFIDILDNVYKTGETFIGNESPITLYQLNRQVVKYLNFIYQASKDLNGKVDGIFFFAVDVTEQVQSRKKIEESEKRFRQIVETAQEGIWLIDEESKTTFVNQKLCEILEYTAEEMLGKPTYLFKDEEGQLVGIKNIERRKEGIDETFESSYITKSGKKIWTRICTNAIFDEDGNYKGALGMVSDITAKKELEDLLDKTNQVARIGSWQVDLLDGSVFWSAVTKEIHEVDQDFIPDLESGINFYKEGESRDSITKAVNESIQKGTPFDLQLQIITAQGNERWVRAIGNIEYLKNVATKLIGSFQDIDAAKKAELEIIGLFKEKNSILESIGDAFFAVDRGWKVTYWNTKAETILAKKKEDILGKNIWEEFPNEVNSSFYHYYHEAVEENKTMHFEAYYQSLDIWFEVNAYPSPTGLSVYFRDISKSKKAEADLKQSEKQYRQIVETAQEGIWLIDENDKTIFVNKKLKNILGYKQKEIIGKKLYHFVDKESQQVAEKSMQTIRMGKTSQADYKFTTKNGHQIIASVTANPIFDDNRKYIGALAMITDITEKVRLQKELQEEQRRSQHELMKAVVDAQEKERAGIGAELHDNVNQLLATSRLYLNICINRPGNNKESMLKSQEYVSEAIEEIRRLSHALVGPTQDRIMGLVPSIKDLIFDVTNTKNINIEFTHDTFREERNEVGLKLVIYRIVQEQVNNILKHAGASKIKIELKKVRKDLVVILEDNGKGFDITERKKGIGLQNINSRAKLYDGTVEINSSPGNGCQMVITFKNHAFGVNAKTIENLNGN